MNLCNCCGETNSVLFYSYIPTRCKVCISKVSKKRYQVKVCLQAFNGKKICSSCGLLQDAVNFSPNKKHKDGLQYKCKPCYNKTKRELSNKRCSSCLVDLASDQFHRHEGHQDGLQAYCKLCAAEKRKLWVAKPQETFKPRQKSTVLSERVKLRIKQVMDSLTEEMLA